jgi:hypothetical protein
MAAAAAAAARKKNDAVPPGGIGVFAAAAASNKKKAVIGGTKDEPMKGSANPDSALAVFRLQRSGSNRGIGESESKAASKPPNERKTWDSERYDDKGGGDTTGSKSPFGVMASNYRKKKDGGEDGARRKEKDPNAEKSEFAVTAARLKKSHSDTEQVVSRSAHAKKVVAKDVPAAAKKVGPKEAPPAGGRSSFSSSAAAYRRKKTKKNFDMEDLESDEEEQSAKWTKPQEHADTDGDEIEASATPPVEEIKPALITEEVKASVAADTKDDDAYNKMHAKIAANSTEIKLQEDAEIEKIDNNARGESVQSAADSAEIKPTYDGDTKDNSAILDERTNIDVSADIEPKEDADTHDGHTTNDVKKETDADSSSVVEPCLEEIEQKNSLAKVAGKSSSVLPPISDNALVEEREQAAASVLVGSPLASAKPPTEKANQKDAAAETAHADAVPSSSPALPISPLGSPFLRPNVERSTAQEEPKASPIASDYHASPPPVELLVGFHTTPTETSKKEEIGLSDFFSSQNNGQKVSAFPLGGRNSLTIAGGLFAKAARSVNTDCGLDDDGDDEDDDSVDHSARDIRSEMLRNNFDDSSVAQMAGTLEQQPMSSRLSETWTKGDTIQNWSGWANQVITASDTDSVVGFEVSMDLRDEGDFDDESTIATFMDDNTIASAPPGYNNPLYGGVAHTPGRVGQSISFEMPAVTPAKVAASILFSDSPTTSVETTPQTANAQHRAEIVLDAGLAFPDDIGLDAGLSFGGDHLDLDDGLGFGGTGGLIDFNGCPVEDDKSPDKKKWFPWGG